MTTREVIELSRHAQDAGADAVMVVAPCHLALSVPEILHYLGNLADSVQLPVRLYNLPVATGAGLVPDVVGRLATDVENTDYIKDTMGNRAQAVQLIRRNADVISFSSAGPAQPRGIVQSAAGVMAGTANVIPAELTTLFRLVGRPCDGATSLDTSGPNDRNDALGQFHRGRQSCGVGSGLDVGLPRDPVPALEPSALATVSRLLIDLPSLAGAHA